MSDSQSGMYTKNEGFAHENCEFGTATYTAAVCAGLVKCRDLLFPISANVATANRMRKPAANGTRVQPLLACTPAEGVRCNNSHPRCTSCMLSTSVQTKRHAITSAARTHSPTVQRPTRLQRCRVAAHLLITHHNYPRSHAYRRTGAHTVQHRRRSRPAFIATTWRSPERLSIS